jgi:hypothetical protein
MIHEESLLVITILFLSCAASITILVPAQQPLDGRDRIFHNDLLDNLAGDSKINALADAHSRAWGLTVTQFSLAVTARSSAATSGSAICSTDVSVCKRF